MNYYNEFDPYAAQWLRNLIAAGHIPQGDVDSRSIKDVKASDLTGYTQCHFFAGLGGWSHALRLAGWPEDRPVWTGSCPCQPFSAAGSGGGVTDERHLWPTWFNLIRECRPDVIFGEQVEAAVNHGWLDLVQTDLEGEGYASGAVGIPAGGVGAPHIRQRLWFVGHTKNSGLQGCALRNNGESANGITQTSVSGQLAKSNGFVRRAEQKSKQPTRGTRGESVRDCGPVSQLADAEFGGVSGGDQRRSDSGGQQVAQPKDRAGVANKFSHGCEDVGVPVANADSGRHNGRATATGRQAGASPRLASGGASSELADTFESRRTWVGGGSGTQEQRTAQCGAASFWSDCDWLPCRDGKARPVEPGTFPLAHGVSGRVGRLRAYGNAIVPQVAQVFIEAYLES